jgi:hypothetical protein
MRQGDGDNGEGGWERLGEGVASGLEGGAGREYIVDQNHSGDRGVELTVPGKCVVKIVDPLRTTE